jgi:hypothetical protein
MYWVEIHVLLIYLLSNTIHSILKSCIGNTDTYTILYLWHRWWWSRLGIFVLLSFLNNSASQFLMHDVYVNIGWLIGWFMLESLNMVKPIFSTLDTSNFVKCTPLYIWMFWKIWIKSNFEWKFDNKCRKIGVKDGHGAQYEIS